MGCLVAHCHREQGCFDLIQHNGSCFWRYFWPQLGRWVHWMIFNALSISVWNNVCLSPGNFCLVKCFLVFFPPTSPGQWAVHWSWIPIASAGRPRGWLGSRLSCARQSLRLCRRWPRVPDWVCVSASINSASAAGTAPVTANILAKSYSRVSSAVSVAWQGDVCLWDSLIKGERSINTIQALLMQRTSSQAHIHGLGSIACRRYNLWHLYSRKDWERPQP